MSGEQGAERVNRQTIMDADTARLAAEYSEPAAEETALEEVPVDVVESEASEDGALALDETEQEESDQEAPETEGEEVVDWEKRYKDTQKHIEETNAEMRALREEQAQAMGEVTQARYELADKFQEAEQAAQYWASQAMGDVQRLQSVNVQQLTQEQYGQWQQQMTAAQQRAQLFQQGFKQTQEQAKTARDEALRREATVARAQLERVIPDFDAVYPEIGKYAVEQGVHPKVWRDITDPGLVRLLHKAMQDSKQPDIIKEVETKTKARKQEVRNLQARDEQGRFRKLERDISSAPDARTRRQLMQERDRLRLEKEYSR